MIHVKNILSALLVVLLLSGAAFAKNDHGKGHGKGHNGEHGNGHGNDDDHGKNSGNGPGHGDDKSNLFKNHFGLSDSCWNVFITRASSGDSTVNFSNLDSSFANNVKQIDSLRHLLDSILGKKGSLTQVRDIFTQLKTLTRADDSIRRASAMIIARNEKLLDSVRLTCGKEIEDSTDVGDTTVVGDTNVVHDSLKIVSIIPNPATVGGNTTLVYTFSSAAQQHVVITLADQLGIVMKTFDLGMLPAGSYTQALDLSGLPAGTYLLRIQAGPLVETRTIIIM